VSWNAEGCSRRIRSLAADSRPRSVATRSGAAARPGDGGPRTITYSEALDDGRTIAISPDVEEILGYTQDEWMADQLLWVQLIHFEDRQRVVEACEEANRIEQPFRAEYRMITRDGRIRWIRDEATVVRGADGQRLCWQGTMRDITEERETPRGSGSMWTTPPRPDVDPAPAEGTGSRAPGIVPQALRG